MKVIISISRGIKDYNLLKRAIKDSGFNITQVVCGMCGKYKYRKTGVYESDMLGYKWGKDNGVPVKEFPAFWSVWPRAAGVKRNQQMVNYVNEDDGLIAIRSKNSRGTIDTIKRAEEKGLKIYKVGAS